MDFRPFAGKNDQFLHDFIYNGERLDIMIKFKPELKGLPFQCYTEKETKNDFEYIYLVVKLNVDKSWGQRVALNHPSLIESELSLDSMLKNASVFISNYIPEIMKRNSKLIENYLNSN